MTAVMTLLAKEEGITGTKAQVRNCHKTILDAEIDNSPVTCRVAWIPAAMPMMMLC